MDTGSLSGPKDTLQRGYIAGRAIQIQANYSTDVRQMGQLAVRRSHPYEETRYRSARLPSSSEIVRAAIDPPRSIRRASRART